LSPTRASTSLTARQSSVACRLPCKAVRGGDLCAFTGKELDKEPGKELPKVPAKVPRL